MPLQDSDNFIIGRGTDSYKITYEDLKDDLNYVPPPVGTINQPTVLEPNDGAGGSDTRYLKSDAITDIEGGGVDTCETDTIQNVEELLYWNQDANWSNSMSVTGSGFSQSPQKAFNGNMGDNASSTTGGATMTFTCPVAFPAGVKLEAKCNRTGGGSHWISVNGGDEFQVFGSDVGAEGFHELPYEPGDEQAFVITFRNNNTGGGTDLTGIRIGGQLLVDTNVSGPGPTLSTVLTFPTNKGFDCFEPGDVVQGDAFSNAYTANYYIANANADPNNVPTKTGTLVTNGANAFDGNIGTNATNVSTNGMGYWLDFPSPFKASTVGLYSTTGGSHTMKACVYDDMGNKVSKTFQEGPLQWRDVDTSSLPGKITSVVWWMPTNKITAWAYRVTANGTQDFLTEGTPSEVKVVSKDEDTNTITVDGGDWLEPADYVNQNRDQVWSNYAVTTGFYPWTGAFDGVTNSTYNTNEAASDAAATFTEWSYTGQEELSFSKIEVWACKDAGGGSETVLLINDTDVSDQLTGNTYGWYELTGVTGPLTSIKMSGYSTPSDGIMRLGGVKLDDKLLVNRGIGGDAKLVKETPYNTTLTVDGDTDLADMGTSAAWMTNGATNADGSYVKSDYLLQTTDIESVDNAQPPATYEYKYTTTLPGGTVTNNATGAGVTPPNWGDLTDYGTVTFGQAPVGGNVVPVWHGYDFGENISPFTAEYYRVPGAYANMVTYYWVSDDGVIWEYGGRLDGINNGAAIFNCTKRYLIQGGNVGGAGNNAIQAPTADSENYYLVASAGNYTVLTFTGDASTNSDLQYFKKDDVVGGALLPATNYSQYCDRYAIEPSIIARGFNGDTISGVYYANDGVGTEKIVSVTSIPNLPKGAPVKVYAAWSNSSASGAGSGNTVLPLTDLYIKFNNDAPFQPQAGAGSVQPELDSVVAADGTFTIEVVTNNGGGPVGWNYSGFYAIEVDGIVLTDNTEQGTPVRVISTDLANNTMTVDGGEWSPGSTPLWQSKTWSSQWNPLAVSGGTDVKGCFDGSKDFAPSAIPSSEWTVDFDYPVTNKVVLGIGIGQYGSSTTVTVKGATDVPKSKAIGTIDDTFMEWTAAELGGIFKGLKLEGNAGEDATPYFGWIEIDGNLLADPAPTTGANHVEYQTNGGEGEIVSVNTDDNTLLIADTGDRDNRWIKGFSVAGPSIIDSPLLTNDVELRVSDFATTPPGADTLKEIIWSINGVEYSANTTNPWSPLEKLPTNSTVTVKVKYKGNILEDSVWSPDVTFTTGASMKSLFTRIAALEANDVTDDATDTALLTLLSNLAIRVQALEESN